MTSIKPRIQLNIDDTPWRCYNGGLTHCSRWRYNAIWQVLLYKRECLQMKYPRLHDHFSKCLADHYMYVRAFHYHKVCFLAHPALPRSLFTSNGTIRKWSKIWIIIQIRLLKKNTAHIMGVETGEGLLSGSNTRKQFRIRNSRNKCYR